MFITEKEIEERLKEEFQTDSPVVPETFRSTGSKGVIGGQTFGMFEFQTRDGDKFEMVLSGEDTWTDMYSRRQSWERIESLKKVN